MFGAEDLLCQKTHLGSTFCATMNQRFWIDSGTTTEVSAGPSALLLCRLIGIWKDLQKIQLDSWISQLRDLDEQLLIGATDTETHEDDALQGDYSVLGHNWNNDDVMRGDVRGVENSDAGGRGIFVI